MTHKIEVRFIKSLHPYRKWDIGFLNERQVAMFEKDGSIEVIVEKKAPSKPAKKAQDKSIKSNSKKVSTK